MKLAFVLLMTISLSACTEESGADTNTDTVDTGSGTLVVINKDDFTAMIVDIPSYEILATLPTGRGEPHEVSISPDGSLAVLTNYGQYEDEPGNTLTVINLVEREIEGEIDLGNYQSPHGIDWINDSDHIVVTAERNQSLLVIDVSTGEIMEAINTEQDQSHIVHISGDNRHAFVANIVSGSLTVIDLKTREVLTTVKTGEGSEGIAVSPDESELWITNRDENTISIVDLSTYEVIESIPSGNFPIRAEFTPDGQHVLVVNLLGSDVSVFEVASRSEIKRIDLEPEMEDTIRPVGIMKIPENKMVVAGTLTGRLYVFDLDNFEIVDHVTVGARPDGLAFTNHR